MRKQKSFDGFGFQSDILYIFDRTLSCEKFSSYRFLYLTIYPKVGKKALYLLQIVFFLRMIF